MSPLRAASARAILGAWLALIIAGSPPAANSQGGEPSGSLPNRVLELDGKGAYVELPTAAFADLHTATVEAWVRWDEWGYFDQWFAYGEPGAWRGLGLNHFGTSSVLQFFIYAGQAEDLHVVSVTAPSQPGMWLHLAAVSGPGGMHFYLGGLLVGEHPNGSSFADLGDETRTYLGKSLWADNAPFHGALDEVRLWSVARSGEQIAADMNRTLSGDEPGLIALWNFDDGDGRDATENHHDGTLQEGARSTATPFPGALPSLRPAVVNATIRDAGGSPVPGASLRLRSPKGHIYDYGTGDRGGLAMAVPDTGWFDVEVQIHNTSIPGRRVHLVSGQSLRLDLRPPPPDLVARWSGEGDARDDVGAHDGTLVGNVTFAQGLIGQAFQFGGSGADAQGTDVVRVPWAPELSSEGSFTVTAWVYPTQDNEMRIVGMWGDGGDWDFQRAYLLMIRPGRRLSFLLSDDARQRTPAFHWFDSRPYVMALGTWTMAAAVWDADRGERRLYVNGALVGRRMDAGVTVTRSIADMGIGANISDPDMEVLWRPFHGRIDEVSLFAVALPEDEIQRLYSVRAQARWHADGDAIDATMSGHDGAMVDVTYEDGIDGQAFAFDGLRSYIEADSRIGNYGVEDFTIDFWLWIDAPTSVTRPLLLKRAGGDVALGLTLGVDGRIDGRLGGPLDSLRVTGREVISQSKWHHIALVRQGTRASLYVDGELDGTATSGETIEIGTRDPLRLGGGPADTSMVGRLDEVALHRRAMTAAEISATHRDALAARSRRLWTSRLQTGSLVGAGLLALVAVGRTVRLRRDRRQERQHLAESERARRLADEANEAKSAFLANMSHEIRTPMNAIMGHAQMLRGHRELDAEQHERSIAAICDHGDILLSLIDDVLDLSKSEAGRMELQTTDFDLGQLLDGLLQLFEVRCRQKDLRLRFERQGDIGVVHGDETKLRQTLINLLGNAVKFTDAGEVSLLVEASESGCRFDVRDTGPGIAPEQQVPIFQPFQQGASGLARGGTGLGLAIAQRHVDLMCGQLRVVSIPGEGTSFSFHVPLQAVAPSAGTARPDVIRVEGLALPAGLRRRMRNAAQMHNVTEVKRCMAELQRLGDGEARLAGALADAVKRFDLASVLEALEGIDDE